MGKTAAERARASVGRRGLLQLFALFHASGWPVFFDSLLRFPRIQCLLAAPPRREGCACAGLATAPSQWGPAASARRCRPPVAAVRRRLRPPQPASRHPGAASPPHRTRPPTARSHLPFVRGAGQRAAPSEETSFHDPPPQRELPCHAMIWCCGGRSRPFIPDARSGCQSRGRLPAPGRRWTTQRQPRAGRCPSLHASGSMVGRPAPSIAHAAERGTIRGGRQASHPIRVGQWAAAGSTRRATARRRPSLAQASAAGVSTGRTSSQGACDQAKDSGRCVKSRPP